MNTNTTYNEYFSNAEYYKIIKLRSYFSAISKCSVYAKFRLDMNIDIFRDEKYLFSLWPKRHVDKWWIITFIEQEDKKLQQLKVVDYYYDEVYEDADVLFSRMNSRLSAFFWVSIDNIIDELMVIEMTRRLM